MAVKGIGDILNKLQKAKQLGNGEYQACCPAHQDKKQSLSLKQDGDKILINCFAGCQTEMIMKKIGLSLSDLYIKPEAPQVQELPPQIVKTYSYPDEDGHELYQVVRMVPKSFRQRHMNGGGEWCWNMEGVRRVLYHLPEVLAATGKVHLVEGEKDVDNLRATGLVATTSPGGANNWRPEYAQYLQNKHVVVIPDKDRAGYKYAHAAIESLKDKAASISVILLPGDNVKDASDWLELGNNPQLLSTMEQPIDCLSSLIDNQPPETSEPKVDSCIVLDKKGNPTLDIARLTITIMGKTTFAFMWDNDTGFYYENGVYKENAERLIAATCQRLVGITPILTEHKIQEIIGHIRRSSYHDRKDFNPEPNIINVKNGLLNVFTGVLSPHTPDYLSNVQNPVVYDPAADCPAIKQFLAEIHNPEDILTMQELFGYLLLRDNRIQKAFLSVGGGENGKSTEQQLEQAFLGPENCAHKSWQQLETDRFASSGLEGKLVNLFADLPSNSLDTTTTFKMLTGGDAIDAERKFKDSYSFLSFAKLIFSTNKPPKVENEDSYAFWRRWIIMEYPRQFTDKDKKPNILQELTTPEELSGLLNYALEGLKRLLLNNKFSYSKTVDQVTEYYMQAADPVYAFAMSSECEIGASAVVPKDPFYDVFVAYCNKNKMPVVKPNAFARYLQNQVAFHVRPTKITVDGIRIPAWQGITLVKTDGKPKEQDKTLTPQQPTMSGMSPDEAASKTSESVRGVRDVRDIPYFNILHAHPPAGAYTELLTMGKNPHNPDNPDEKTKKPTKLEKLGGQCPVCGQEDTDAMWTDDSPEGFYYYCTNCYIHPQGGKTDDKNL
jgi:putative DNA primase/helicase